MKANVIIKRLTVAILMVTLVWPAVFWGGILAGTMLWTSPGQMVVEAATVMGGSYQESSLSWGCRQSEFDIYSDMPNRNACASSVNNEKEAVVYINRTLGVLYLMSVLMSGLLLIVLRPKTYEIFGGNLSG
ncbi:hypothetical protein CT690_23920 [Serratia plymuthica]|uniref:Uncharacterized protein n=1 Tax=Serratia plymuthica TaxID=82996 RepID=A0A318NYD5_SERPL|nr:hypothetical protein [Serratia plymuthica]PYD36596.1 hypothetical protein CT690_23920 [Serratia plymuthica]